MNWPQRALMVFGGSFTYLMLAVFGMGGVTPFFAHPPLIALAMALLVISGIAVRAGGSLNPGTREDRSNRWVLIPFFLIGALLGFVPAWSDRMEFWTFDGDSLRWLGVTLFALGCGLRIWPVFVLGDRFSGLVAIQPGHTLVTTGIYARIRNPSYLGLLITTIGWSLAFRSGAGLLLTALLVPPLIARIHSEERLLHDEFGTEYDAYRARTSRLIPGVY